MLIAIGLLLLRLALELIFLLHGAQKLFGVFGGHGLAGTTQFMNMLGLHPAKWWATIAAWGEFIGGLLLGRFVFEKDGGRGSRSPRSWRPGGRQRYRGAPAQLCRTHRRRPGRCRAQRSQVGCSYPGWHTGRDGQ